jgi:hypothetical protein
VRSRWWGAVLALLSFVGVVPPVLADLEFAKDDAKLIVRKMPTQVKSGQEFEVVIEAKNTGNTIWRRGVHYYALGTGPAKNYKGPNGPFKIVRQEYPLPAENDQGNRAMIKPDGEVRPGQSYLFSFTLQAPKKVGDYQVPWRMLIEGEQAQGSKDGWFGMLLERMVKVVDK